MRERLAAVFDSLPVEFPELQRSLPKTCVKNHFGHSLRMFHGKNSDPLRAGRSAQQVDLTDASQLRDVFNRRGDIGGSRRRIHPVIRWFVGMTVAMNIDR